MRGIDDLVEEVLAFKQYEESNGLLLKKRNKRKVSELNAMIDKRLRNELEKTQETATFKELMNKLENGLLEPELLVEKIINLIKKNN